MRTLRDYYGTDIAQQRFTFAETVALSGVEPKHLRNYVEPGRAIISVTERAEGGRWLFDLRTVLVLSLMQVLTRFIGLKPVQAADAAQVMADYARDEVLNSWVADRDNKLPPGAGPVLLTFEAGRVQAFAYPGGEEVDWYARDLVTGQEIGWDDPNDPAPDLENDPHVRLSMDSIISDFTARYARLPSTEPRVS